MIHGKTSDALLGSRVDRNTWWVGNHVVSPSVSILIMAGHADSQFMKGAGTSGEAVALKGYPPMNSKMSDELFWNLKVRDAVVRLGKAKGLKIKSYEPGIRKIIDDNNEKTNWTVGSRYSSQGAYVLEIHFDAYGNHGLGSGLIPPLTNRINNIDESIARSFGRYPLFFRGGLGAPRRQIRVLEIGKLEGDLEKNLRQVNSSEKTIDQIADRIVNAILIGLNKKDLFNQQLNKGDIFLQDSHLQTNLGAL
ncbi:MULTISPECIES: N-acetylmuramoyl-L-alanine amidase [unclassified Prochlorococcus]|uniref:N-acetylmuramoyl-L-alanine amidase n=1 Tax=unclassified Prochlorococcus TaxID=2627481 RepID=UPI001269855D|nr:MULTISPECIES: N-acetylmuramoyl-L-alanine amidase [unclassified Prochlorococcus]